MGGTKNIFLLGSKKIVVKTFVLCSYVRFGLVRSRSGTCSVMINELALSCHFGSRILG